MRLMFVKRRPVRQQPRQQRQRQRRRQQQQQERHRRRLQQRQQVCVYPCRPTAYYITRLNSNNQRNEKPVLAKVWWYFMRLGNNGMYGYRCRLFIFASSLPAFVFPSLFFSLSIPCRSVLLSRSGIGLGLGLRIVVARSSRRNFGLRCRTLVKLHFAFCICDGSLSRPTHSNKQCPSPYVWCIS